MRIKNRYLIAQALPPCTLGTTVADSLEIQSLVARDFHQSLREKIQELYGDVGSGDIGANTAVKFYDGTYTNILIVRSPREYETQVHFALSALSKVRATEVCIRSLSVKSTSRSCIEALQELIKVYITATVPEDSVRNAVIESLRHTISTLEM